MACTINLVLTEAKYNLDNWIFLQEIISGISLGYGLYYREAIPVIISGIIYLTGAVTVKVREAIDRADNYYDKRLK